MLADSIREYSDNNADYSVVTDEQGYLVDPLDWSRAFTERRAREAGIVLKDGHWRLVEMIREKYLNLGALPPLRSICKAVGFDKHELKLQFGSCLNLWKMAGLPDPGEEARAYMN
jgi:TusE/DsrC/DsvC family sulfur relay protein